MSPRAQILGELLQPHKVGNYNGTEPQGQSPGRELKGKAIGVILRDIKEKGDPPLFAQGD